MEPVTIKKKHSEHNLNTLYSILCTKTRNLSTLYSVLGTKIKIFVLCTLYFVLSCTATSCKKEVKKFDVIYEVNFPKGNAVSISYNSDYYAATGERKDIVYNTDSTNQYYSTVWYARRYAFQKEGYYIKVDYTNLQHKDSTYKVSVYVNDELKDEKSGSTTLEIQGDI